MNRAASENMNEWFLVLRRSWMLTATQMSSAIMPMETPQ